MEVKKGLIDDLYAEYKLTTSSKAYTLMWTNVMELVSHYLKKWLKKLSITVEPEELYDLTVDGTCKVMQKVKDKDDIKSFSGLIYYVASNLLRDRKARLERENKLVDLNEYLQGEDDKYAR